MRKTALIILCCTLAVCSMAQRDTTEERGFRKDKLFTGGDVAFSFGGNLFLIGANPVLGYNLESWVDAGIAINYIYSSYRHYQGPSGYEYIDYRLRETLYGGGIFTRLYPVDGLFAQGQLEVNHIHFNFTWNDGTLPQLYDRDAMSLLVGAGYATGRTPDNSSIYGYISVLFDVMKDPNSPYINQEGRIIPIVRGGITIPLFQGTRHVRRR